MCRVFSGLCCVLCVEVSLARVGSHALRGGRGERGPGGLDARGGGRREIEVGCCGVVRWVIGLVAFVRSFLCGTSGCVRAVGLLIGFFVVDVLAS